MRVEVNTALVKMERKGGEKRPQNETEKKSAREPKAKPNPKKGAQPDSRSHHTLAGGPTLPRR